MIKLISLLMSMKISMPCQVARFFTTCCRIENYALHMVRAAIIKFRSKIFNATTIPQRYHNITPPHSLRLIKA